MQVKGIQQGLNISLGALLPLNYHDLPLEHESMTQQQMEGRQSGGRQENIIKAYCKRSHTLSRNGSYLGSRHDQGPVS
jgi:hypothetical protein